MCDYSLEGRKTRDAVAGENITMIGFHGFCAPEDQEVAVCLRPGTELAIEIDLCPPQTCPTCDTFYLRDGGVDRLFKTTAIFRHRDIGPRGGARDMLEFPGGETILLHYLPQSGKTRAIVLQIPAKEEPAPFKAAAEALASL